MPLGSGWTFLIRRARDANAAIRAEALIFDDPPPNHWNHNSYMNLQKFVTLHFHFAVWLSIACGIAAFNNPELVLSDEDGMYGPLRNNLLFAVGYLLLGQIGLWYVRYLKGGYFEALVMGYTFLATAFGAKVYADVNGMPVSGYFIMALLYFALAHGLYYFLGRRREDDLQAASD